MAKPDKHQYPSVHCGIVRAAVHLLDLEKHAAAARFSAGDTETLVEEAAAPDRIGDRQQGRGMHYYCAVKPDGTPLPYHPLLGGYCNGKNAPAPSPLTMLDAEYRTALSLYRAGKYIPALKSLSRAMHHLADICCPPHSCGLTYFSRYALAHKRYEARAAEIFWCSDPSHTSAYHVASDWAKKAVGTVPHETYTGLLRSGMPQQGDEWQSSRFAEICNQLALSGANELSAVLDDDEVARDASITRRLLLAIAHCAALLAAFDRDLQNPSAAVWEEKRPYWLKGFGTAYVLTSMPLYLQFEDDGTVTLQTQERQYLAVGRAGQTYLTDAREDLTTRFRFGREPLLTLHPEGDQQRLLALIRGKLYCVRRKIVRQPQTFFVLTCKRPEKAKFIF